MVKGFHFILVMTLIMGVISSNEKYFGGGMRGSKVYTNEITQLNGEDRELYYGGKKKQRYYYKYYSSGSYYKNADDVTDDTTGNFTEYDDDNVLQSKWKSIEKQVVAQAQAWYSTSPGNWSSNEWAFLIGIIISVVSLSICILSCCCGCCCGSESEEIKTRKEHDFDDYTSVDSYAKKSIIGAETSSSDWDTTMDDATYDAIMRLRSKS